MLRFVILSLTLIALINSSNISKTTATPPGTYQNDKTFVETACNLTTYPTMCYNALSSYSSTINSDPIKFCLTSLNVNLESAKSALSVFSGVLKKIKLLICCHDDDPNVLIYCIKKMMDITDELKQVIAEIMNLKGGITSKEEIKRKFETWASSALTEMTSCKDKFKDENVNEEINKAISELSITTSNSMAIIANYLLDLPDV